MASEGPRTGERGPLSRDLILSLYLPAVAISLGQGIAAPALPILAKSFDVSFGVASLVTVMYGLGGVIATLPTGYLIDRFGRRRVLLAGPVLTAISAFLTAFASPTFEWLLAWRFIGGATAQAWELSRLTMISDSGAERMRGRMMIWMFQMSSVSMLLAPSVGGFVAEWDIRIPFVLHGVFTLIAIVPSIRLIAETDPTRVPGHKVPKMGEAATWKYVFKAMRGKEMVAFLVAQFLANIARGLTMGGVMNLYVAYAYNASAVTIGLLNTASSVFTIPVGFLSGAVMDKWGRKRTIVPGFSAFFVALLIVGATAWLNAPFEWFVPTWFFMNMTTSVVGGNMQVLGADLAPPLARGRFIGAWRLIGRAGSPAGAGLFGWVAEVVGYAAAFAVLGLNALAVAFIVGIFIRETVGRERPPSA